MSTDIYYFSGTGNSLHLARELQKLLPDAQLIPILSLVSQDSVIATGRTVGLIFPHYASSLPKVVHSFVEKLDLGSAGYLFAIATRGRTRTMAFQEIDRILAARGRQLDAFSVVTMPSGSEPLVKGYASKITAERISRLESEMLAGLDRIQRTIMNHEIMREEEKADPTPPPRFLAPLVPMIQAVSPLLVPLGKLVESSFDFYVDEKCTACGICEKVCLAGKVQMVRRKPVWQETVPCHGCLACLNFCPEESVQVESKWYLRSYTRQNGRYHHPAITASDIADQKLVRVS